MGVECPRKSELLDGHAFVALLKSAAKKLQVSWRWHWLARKLSSIQICWKDLIEEKSSKQFTIILFIYSSSCSHSHGKYGSFQSLKGATFSLCMWDEELSDDKSHDQTVRSHQVTWEKPPWKVRIQWRSLSHSRLSLGKKGLSYLLSPQCQLLVKNPWSFKNIVDLVHEQTHQTWGVWLYRS